MNKKILVVLTGGTIGSAVNINTIDISAKSPYRLLQAYEQMKYDDLEETVFETVQPYNILSENTTLDVWTQLCDFLSNVDMSLYKGIIITHGTDTYSYTSALLGTIYDKAIPIPMVLVSSNYAIGEPKSNGLANFRNAVCFINQAWCSSEPKSTCIDMTFSGVFCVYEDRFGVSNVYRAVEITESDTCIDQFGVYGGEVYGIMHKEVFHKNVKHVNRCEPMVEVKNKKITFSKEVMMLKTYPGLNYSYIGIEHLQEGEHKYQLGAVLHNLYHSATACVSMGEESFVSFIERCEKAGIPSYVCGFKKNLKDAYASTRIFEKSNITKVYDMSPEAAYANVLLKLNI